MSISLRAFYLHLKARYVWPMLASVPLIVAAQLLLSNYFFAVPFFPGVYIFPPDYTPILWAFTALILVINLGWTLDRSTRKQQSLLRIATLTGLFATILLAQLISSMLQFNGLRGLSHQTDLTHDLRNALCFASLLVILRVLGGPALALLGIAVLLLAIVGFGKSSRTEPHAWCIFLQPSDSMWGLILAAVLALGAYVVYTRWPAITVTRK